MALFQSSFFASPGAPVSASPDSVDAVEVAKPKKVGRPRKKKETDDTPESVEVVSPSFVAVKNDVVVGESILKQGECMTVSELASENSSELQRNGVQNYLSANAEEDVSDQDEMDSDGNSNSYDGRYSDDEEGEDAYSDPSLAPNQLLVTLSYSLMSQVKQMARMEGVSPDDIILELVAEGVTKRAFQEFSRPKPSHLMTRTGYVPPEANGNSMAQPQMSHHMQMPQQGNGRGAGMNNGNRRFGNNGNGGNGGNGQYFNNGRNNNQNQNQPQRFSNGHPHQGRPNNGGQNNPKNAQRHKKSFNPNFQRNGNGAPNGGGHANGNTNGQVNPGSSGPGLRAANSNGFPDKDSDE